MHPGHVYFLWIVYDSVIVQAVAEFSVVIFVCNFCSHFTITRIQCELQPKEVRLWTLVPVAIYAA